ncbi:MAG TPA: hypothetical protein HPP59_02280 [Deltaproteobacteria bacterium]|nr:hypothetical protein [Deltaproteobacteria bacterium]
MNSARRGENLFADDTDYQQFIELIQETVKLFHVNVVAFCLMSTHYHVMVQAPHANLSRCMRHLNGVYTQMYNLHHGRDDTPGSICLVKPQGVSFKSPEMELAL